MKANAGKLNVGHAGIGSVFFITGLLLHSILKVKPTMVPFNGGLPAMNALVAGQVDYPVRRRDHRRAAARSRQDQGLCDRVAAAQSGAAERADQRRRPGCLNSRPPPGSALFAPKGTPKPILDRLTDALDKALDDARRCCGGATTKLICGTICASGTLGQIIPPSVILILLGDIMGVPVGDLYIGAVVPGLVLVGLYIMYIFVLGVWKPELAPPIPAEELAAFRGEALKRVTHRPDPGVRPDRRAFSARSSWGSPRRPRRRRSAPRAASS